MHKVTIQPQWSVRQPDGRVLSSRLVALLVQVHEHGSLAVGCRHCALSYRHAWEMLRQGESVFGAPLVQMARGRGSRLTPLGEKLVWAEHRIAARLSPVLDSLASEIEVEISRSVAPAPVRLRVHASHGFAIEKLLDLLGADGSAIERKYVGSQEAVAALRDGGCDVAGFQVPLGEFEARSLAHYAGWLDARTQRVIDVATRRQGLVVARGNPLRIRDVRDLARPEVRFINRLRGSGTRFLLEALLAQAGVDAARINGWEQGEYTHAAVAAFVASGMADAGFGIETPARHFRLDFVPIASERYFLLCDEATLATPPLQAAIAVLRGQAFHDAIARLPGYGATEPGRVQTLAQAFPDFAGFAGARAARARRPPRRVANGAGVA